MRRSTALVMHPSTIFNRDDGVMNNLVQETPPPSQQLPLPKSQLYTPTVEAYRPETEPRPRFDRPCHRTDGPAPTYMSLIHRTPCPEG